MLSRKGEGPRDYVHDTEAKCDHLAAAAPHGCGASTLACPLYSSDLPAVVVVPTLPV